MNVAATLITLVLVIFAGVFMFFGVGMLLDRDVSGTKLMLLGIHISLLGVIFNFFGALSLSLVILGFLLSFISFFLDSKEA